MESLARMVVLMFALGAVTGPLACLLAWFRLRILACFVGVGAAVCGLFWFEVAPWPIGATGLLNAFLGVLAVISVWRGNNQ